jgi:transposase-like protein
MPVETLGEACSQGWRVTVRCADVRTESPRSQSSRECSHRTKLDMVTLVWTRGRAFPLSRLESRLRCPRCGSRYVVTLYEPLRGGATSIAGPRSRLVRSSTA